VINIYTNQNSEGTANLDATELLELLLLPHAIEILKRIESNPLGVDLKLGPGELHTGLRMKQFFP
jgi:hypothetical protein